MCVKTFNILQLTHPKQRSHCGRLHPFKFCKLNYTTVSIFFSKGGGLPASNSSNLATHWLTASPAKPGLAEVAVTQTKPRPNQLRFPTPDRPASARFLRNIKRLWNRPLSAQSSLISRSHARTTYSIVWEQPGVIVQYEPAVLPPLHDVSPFAQRPLHDGRHFFTCLSARGEERAARKTMRLTSRAELCLALGWLLALQSYICARCAWWKSKRMESH